MSGTLIVLEGTDGSGKSTQFSLAVQDPGAGAAPLPAADFSPIPAALLRADPHVSGRRIRPPPLGCESLRGLRLLCSGPLCFLEKGVGRVLYRRRAGALRPVYHLQRGPSGLQAARTGVGGLFQWLYDFEHAKLGLPRPDLVVYLDMPTERSIALLRAREQATHTQGDIHEVDAGYLALCRKTALRAAECLGWRTVACVDAGRRSASGGGDPPGYFSADPADSSVR